LLGGLTIARMAIVCHCEVVRERTIVKAVQRGATTLAEVQAACGAATRCGGCEPAVRELLQRAGAPADTHVHIRPAFGLSA
jgi:NAD(P)H-nitrite reductase large subunit